MQTPLRFSVEPIDQYEYLKTTAKAKESWNIFASSYADKLLDDLDRTIETIEKKSWHQRETKTKAKKKKP